MIIKLMLKKTVLPVLCFPLWCSANAIAATNPSTELPNAPKCGDKQVVDVLSNAFLQQGKATGVNMTVTRLQAVKETAHYPDKKIRQCHAIVHTVGGDYQADYSIAVQNNQFFVQAENVLPLVK